MQKYEFSLTRYLPYKDRIMDFTLWKLYSIYAVGNYLALHAFIYEQRHNAFFQFSLSVA